MKFILKMTQNKTICIFSAKILNTTIPLKDRWIINIPMARHRYKINTNDLRPGKIKLL